MNAAAHRSVLPNRNVPSAWGQARSVEHHDPGPWGWLEQPECISKERDRDCPPKKGREHREWDEQQQRGRRIGR
jgi:hypothetical protein